ncbi:hypothetical protein ABZ412_28310 [Nocardia sp. NPDC005746]|uniref:hypothetical protein n=1 Tax=Nocardia sp. NPDC005746 TaxID=3157062 RepID=UPI0033C30B34
MAELSADTGRSTVTYRPTPRYADGRNGTEPRRARLVPSGGSYLIDSAEPVS